MEITHAANTNRPTLESLGEEVNQYYKMVIDAVGPSFTATEDANVEEELNMQANKFYEYASQEDYLD